MTLREFLDEVTFGNVARLCVAVRGEDDFLDNYEEGKYWELPAGNWENGSNSKACPVIPEEIMDAEVDEVNASPNLRYVYKNLGELYGHSLDTTVILVDAWDFDADNYWEENKLNTVPVRCAEDYGTEWPYAISVALWEEIQDMADNCQILSQAIYNIPLVGLQTITGYSEEDFEKMDAYSSQLMRLGQKIAMKISRLDEVLALLQLTETGTTFNSRFL
jgi:hypothetical protein